MLRVSKSVLTEDGEDIEDLGLLLLVSICRHADMSCIVEASHEAQSRLVSDPAHCGSAGSFEQRDVELWVGHHAGNGTFL